MGNWLMTGRQFGVEDLGKCLSGETEGSGRRREVRAQGK